MKRGRFSGLLDQVNSNKKPTGAKGVAQPFNRQAGNAPQLKSMVAQAKTAVSALSVKRRIAPAVYQPQRLKVAQAKMIAPVKAGVSAQSIKRPVAPPLYRPHDVPRSVQAKMTGSLQPKIRPVAPLVFRPQTLPKVLQTKKASIQLSKPLSSKAAAYVPLKQPSPPPTQQQQQQQQQVVVAPPQQQQQQQQQQQVVVAPPQQQQQQQQQQQVVVAPPQQQQQQVVVAPPQQQQQQQVVVAPPQQQQQQQQQQPVVVAPPQQQGPNIIVAMPQHRQGDQVYIRLGWNGAALSNHLLVTGYVGNGQTCRITAGMHDNFGDVLGPHYQIDNSFHVYPTARCITNQSLQVVHRF